MKIKNYFNKARLLLILVVLVLYANTLRNGYSLDDSIVTERSNLTTKGISAIPKILRSYYIERAHNIKFEYRPLVKVAFAIEHELFGVNAAVSHAINILLYLLIVLLVYSTLQLLFQAYDDSVAFYSALLFALMPIHTEVVASLKNREELLCFLFSILAFRQFLRFFDSGFKAWLLLLQAVLASYLAFLSKLDALPFLAVIPVLAYARNRLHLRQALLFGAFLAGAALLYLLTKRGMLDKNGAKRVSAYFENPLFFSRSWFDRIPATFNSLGFYIVQCLFPFKQSCYYGYNTLPVLRLGWQGWLGIAATPLIIYGLVRSFLKKDLLLFSGLFFFCATVSMFLNLVRPAVGIVAERFGFAASLGFAIVLVTLMQRPIQAGYMSKKRLQLAGIAVAILFGGTVVARNRDWKSLDSIILTDQAKYPNSAFLNYHAAIAIVQGIEQKRTRVETMEQQKQLFRKARTFVLRSVNTDPTYVPSRSYLCYIDIYLLNDFRAALPHIDTALSMEKNTELLFYKAICMRETKQADSAEFYLKKCLELDAAYQNAYNLLAYDYNLTKQYAKTIALYRYALSQHVVTPATYNGLGKAYWEMGDTANAVTFYQQALDADPVNEEAIAMLRRLKKH